MIISTKNGLTSDDIAQIIVKQYFKKHYLVNLHEKLNYKKSNKSLAKIFVGYLLVAVALNQASAFRKLDLYIESYFFHSGQSQDVIDYPIASHWVLILSISTIPVAWMLRKEVLRIPLFTVISAGFAVCLLIGDSVKSYLNLRLILTSVGAISQAAASAIPLLAVREYLRPKVKDFGSISFYLTAKAIEKVIGIMVVLLIDPEPSSFDPSKGYLDLALAERGKKKLSLVAALSFALSFCGLILIYFGLDETTKDDDDDGISKGTSEDYYGVNEGGEDDLTNSESFKLRRRRFLAEKHSTNFTKSQFEKPLLSDQEMVGMPNSSLETSLQNLSSLLNTSSIEPHLVKTQSSVKGRKKTIALHKDDFNRRVKKSKSLVFAFLLIFLFFGFLADTLTFKIMDCDGSLMYKFPYFYQDMLCIGVSFTTLLFCGLNAFYFFRKFIYKKSKKEEFKRKKLRRLYYNIPQIAVTSFWSFFTYLLLLLVIMFWDVQAVATATKETMLRLFAELASDLRMIRVVVWVSFFFYEKRYMYLAVLMTLRYLGDYLALKTAKTLESPAVVLAVAYFCMVCAYLGIMVVYQRKKKKLVKLVIKARKKGIEQIGSFNSTFSILRSE